MCAGMEQNAIFTIDTFYALDACSLPRIMILTSTAATAVMYENLHILISTENVLHACIRIYVLVSGRKNYVYCAIICVNIHMYELPMHNVIQISLQKLHRKRHVRREQKIAREAEICKKGKFFMCMQASMFIKAEECKI
jgi:hypothetical protein